MCVNFKAPLKQRLAERMQAALFDEDCPAEVFIGYRAPILRRPHKEQTGIELIPATFGLIPFWAKDESQGRHCYNARNETIAEKPSFKTAFKNKQFAAVPMLAFYEPFYETRESKSQRYAIHRADHEMFFAAAIFDRWTKGEQPVISFSLITVNADQHPVVGRFHKHDDEKRTLAILRDDQIDDWLNATPDSARTFFTTNNVDHFTYTASPPPPRKKATA